MNVLILHASAGAGHRRAAEALEKAFRAEGAEPVVRDILDFTAPLFRKTYAKGYLDVVRRAPELWGYLYAQSDKSLRIPWKRTVRSLFNALNTRDFKTFFRECRPDAVVCTHFMPLEILSARIAKGKTDVPLYCVVTDFGVHGLWVVEHVRRYYVACPEAERQLKRRGKDAERVRLTGIPIDPVFAAGETAPAARRRLGLDPDLPAALLLSGGYGVGPAVEMVRAFKGAGWRGQLLVVAGANEKLKEKAEAEAAGLDLPVTVFGFVKNIHDLMDAADLVITKPGGLTTSEVLAKGRPMLVIDPIPGQEQRNGEYALEIGAAARLYEAEDAPAKIRALFEEAGRLERMARCARAAGRPHAARDVARDVLGDAGH